MYQNRFKRHRTVTTRIPQWMIVTALIIGFLGIVAALPAAAGNQGSESGEIAYFLTDPELGVVGAYRNGEQVLFFEAQRNIIMENGTPVLDVYARILDGNVQTIAVAASGPDLPAGWDGPQKSFTAEQAVAVDLAQPMTSALSSADIDPAFALEHTIIAQLVQSIAMQGLSSEGVTTYSVPAIFGDDDSKMTEIVTETRDYINGLQQELVIDRSDSATALDVPHNLTSLSGSFRGIQFEAFREYVEDQLADGPLRVRVEVYSRFFNKDGQISASFGGHEVPAGWGWLDEEAEPGQKSKKRPPKRWPKFPWFNWDRNSETADSSADRETADGLSGLFADMQKIGDTITAARAIEHAQLDFLDAEKASLVAQTAGLRGDLLPKAYNAAISREDDVRNLQESATATATNLWRKVRITLHYGDIDKVGPIPIPPGLPFGTHHSATRVSKWYWYSSGRYLRYHSSINLCNHGRCPYGEDMQYHCRYWSPYFNADSWDQRMPKYTTSYGGGTYHSCLTNYNIFSGAFGTAVKPTGKCWVSIRGHNCNDDTKTQLRYVKGEKPGLCRDDCNNSYGRFECPNCE